MRVPPQLLRAEFTLRGIPRVARLRIPSAGEVLALILDKDIRSASLVESALMLELQALIEDLDGEELDEQTARHIAAEPEALACVLRVRNALYNDSVIQGRAFARCPHCGDREIEADLLFYWMTLKLPPWNFFDQGVLMNPPSLSTPLPLAARPPDIPRAAGIRVVYPAESRFESAFSSVAPALGGDREVQAWATWVDSVNRQPPERSHWRRRSPGFRAVLRLSVALAPEGPLLSPEVVEALPIGAFLFLDLLHFAASNVAIGQSSRVSVACPGCSGVFLPVF